MADIHRYPFVRHLRSEPTVQTLLYQRGTLARSGRGLALWFRPLVSAVAEVPLDDRDLDFRFAARSSDFQDVAVQGVITFRVADAELLAQRIDFSVDLDTGVWLKSPIERIQSTITQLAQQVVWEYFSRTDLRTLLVEGVDESRRRIESALAAESQLSELGLAVVTIRVAAIRPSPETEKALEMPTRERIQQAADEATFQRRAEAVENERAIQENELQNRIELTRRQEELVLLEGANRRREAEEEAEQILIAAKAEAERIGLVERAEVAAERERADLFSGLSPVATIALVADKLPSVGQLVLTPDLLTSVAARALTPTDGGGDDDD
jgi:regulator of protease activity HflC (stomatin/prohibitin superfamily)